MSPRTLIMHLVSTGYGLEQSMVEFWAEYESARLVYYVRHLVYLNRYGTSRVSILRLSPRIQYADDMPLSQNAPTHDTPFDHNSFYFFLSLDAPLVLAVPRNFFDRFLRCLPVQKGLTTAGGPHTLCDTVGWTYAAVGLPSRALYQDRTSPVGRAAQNSSSPRENRR